MTCLLVYVLICHQSHVTCLVLLFMFVMETEQLTFSSAVQHAKTSIGWDDLLLMSEQVEVLKTLYQSKNYFMWFPTGYGKSLCYQLLPFLFDHKCSRIGAHETKLGIVIVVSPLMSLIVVSPLMSLIVVSPLMSLMVVSPLMSLIVVSPLMSLMVVCHMTDISSKHVRWHHLVFLYCLFPAYFLSLMCNFTQNFL